MEFIIFLIVAPLALTFAIVSVGRSSKDEDYFGICYSIIVLILCVMIFKMIIDDFKEPQAIDVYRGKTTLQITYRDSIQVDTVVIFKNKF